jgi:hypothetical protein
MQTRWIWGVTAITLLAALLRFASIFTFPPQAWVDEIWFALRARELLQTGQFQIFYKTFWGGVNPLLVDLTALAQWLGLGNVITSSRAVSTVFGVLGVPLTYACLDEFWRGEWPASRRRWIAASAALVLAYWYFTVNLSRLGTEPAVSLAAGIFCIWQWRRAVRIGPWMSFVLAGLAAGLAQYVSPHARFILPALAVFGVHDWLCARPAQRRSLLAGFGLTAAAAVIAALPLIAFFVREPEWFVGRAGAVTVSLRQTGLARGILENAWRVALSFSVHGDDRWRDNFSGRPLLDWIQSAGFYLGLWWATRHWRASARARDVLLWMLVMISPALITDGAPSFSRMIGGAVPIAALTSIGWAQLWNWLRPRLPAPRLAVVAGLGLAVSLGVNVYDYFVRYAAVPEIGPEHTTTPVELARELIQRAQAEAVFAEQLPAMDDVYAFDFLFPGTPVRRLDFRQCLPLTDERAARTTYLVRTAHDPLTLPELRRAYPSAALTFIEPEEAALMGSVALVDVPPGALFTSMQAAAHADFGPGLELIGYDISGRALRAGESVFVTLYWKAETTLDADLTAFAHLGTGLQDSANIAQRDGQPCQGFYPTSQWQVGDVIPDRFAITVPAGVAAGDYPLAVGWYRYPSLERVPLVEAEQPLPDNRAIVTTVRVAAP